GRAHAHAVLAAVAGRAAIVVVASHAGLARLFHALTGLAVAGADVAHVRLRAAVLLHAFAHARAALVVARARRPIVAGRRVVDVAAAGRLFAAVVRARVIVVAVGRLFALLALAGFAGAIARAGLAV